MVLDELVGIVGGRGLVDCMWSMNMVLDELVVLGVVLLGMVLEDGWMSWWSWGWFCACGPGMVLVRAGGPGDGSGRPAWWPWGWFCMSWWWFWKSSCGPGDGLELERHHATV